MVQNTRILLFLTLLLAPNLANDPEESVLADKLTAAGIDPGRVVFDYVDEPDVSYL